MHHIEPYWNWRNLYAAETDQYSPFYGREYSEFFFSDHVYDHYIHPQWDNIDSDTLFIKILFTDYEEGFTIMEFIGEWNDAINNDIMHLKRNIIDLLIENGIDKFILIGENILNYHPSDDCYYEEWFEDIEDGWIATINFREHILDGFSEIGIDQYLVQGGQLNELEWRTYRPLAFYQKVKQYVQHRIV